MIKKISSSLSSFKEIEFHDGLNVLIAKKESGATDRQTRNRAGKSSLIEIISFLFGANAKKESLFRTTPLINESFRLDFDLHGEAFEVSRKGKQPSRVATNTTNTNSKWLEWSGKKMFALDVLPDYAGRKPTFRSLFSYFVRREHSNAFIQPEKQAKMQQKGDWQVALMYLMGLDWTIASDWQKVRDREKTLKELKKAANDDAFGNLIGKSAELRTKLTVAKSRLTEIKDQVKSFKIFPKYRELELEADQITESLNQLSNNNTIDSAVIRDLRNSLNAEKPPEIDMLKTIYAEAGVVLPKVALRKYDEVRSFHESVVRNRHDYLDGELHSAKDRINNREKEKGKLDKRRAEIMTVLESHGALEQFANLQGEQGRLEAEVESLARRFELAEQIEGTKNELDIERNNLVSRLRRNFSEQERAMSEAILAFQGISKSLYESAGSMNIKPSKNGPVFEFPMQGERSKGIKNIQIFCFDMMLMQLCYKKNIGSEFLIHDSHLFDGVDGRQIISALKIGAQTAKNLGFQYIVTLNEDDAFKETIEGFDLNDYVLPVSLTDATEDGGLFGCRF
jgi:uncharacterized protein YydD (DUF2326 family)